MAKIGFDQHAMLGHREGMVALGLAVPAGDAGEAMGNVLDLDVERRRIEQVEPAAGQHALPGAGRSAFNAGRASLRLVAVAIDEVVVHQPAGLHEGIDDGGADKAEAALLQVFRDFLRQRRLAPAIAAMLRKLFCIGLPSRKPQR
jgi:hypothetical protein